MIVLLAACVRAPPASAVGPPAVLPPPAITERDLFTLLMNPGTTPIVVNFWATWCAPCVDELPELASVSEEFPNVDVLLVSVDDPLDANRVAVFAARYAPALDLVHLSTRDAPAILGRAVPSWPDAIPVTLVVEPGGAIRARYDGRLDAAALRAALR